MLDHRMRLVTAQLADDAQQDRPRLRGPGGAFDLALARIGLDVVEPLEKIIVPGDAPVFAVGRRLEPDHLLLADDVLDLAVFDRRQFVGADFAARAFLPRFLQRRGAQQATDVVGAERRLGTLHTQPQTSSVSSTIIRSFAHCSSSASTLPSSVEAKPHCGDRQSWSSATYFTASSIRRLMASFFSSVPLLEVTRPSTICFWP